MKRKREKEKKKRRRNRAGGFLFYRIYQRIKEGGKKKNYQIVESVLKKGKRGELRSRTTWQGEGRGGTGFFILSQIELGEGGRGGERS